MNLGVPPRITLTSYPKDYKACLVVLSPGSPPPRNFPHLLWGRWVNTPPIQLADVLEIHRPFKNVCPDHPIPHPYPPAPKTLP